MRIPMKYSQRFFLRPNKKLVSQNKLSHMIIRIHICIYSMVFGINPQVKQPFLGFQREGIKTVIYMYILGKGP